jgi:hypothetical protein
VVLIGAGTGCGPVVELSGAPTRTARATAHALIGPGAAAPAMAGAE